MIILSLSKKLPIINVENKSKRINESSLHFNGGESRLDHYK
jgi:hypothetical protein